RVGIILSRAGPSDTGAAPRTRVPSDSTRRTRHHGVLAVARRPPADRSRQRRPSHSRGLGMTSNIDGSARKPLRLWPGIIAAALVMFGYILIVTRQNALYGMFGGVGGALLILLWWLLFSRARWYERVAAIPLIAAATWAQRFFVHPSIAGGAMENLS